MGIKEQKEEGFSLWAPVIHLFNKRTFIGHLLSTWHSLSLRRVRCPVWLCAPLPRLGYELF